MKHKKILWGLLGLAGATAATYMGGRIAKEKSESLEREEAVAQVRSYFEGLGSIATVYILLYETTADTFYGGVVMEDGRHFAFELEGQDLHYVEEKA